MEGDRPDGAGGPRVPRRLDERLREDRGDGLLDRALSSFTLRDVLHGYVLYLVVGAVVALIGLVVLLGVLGASSGGVSSSVGVQRSVALETRGAPTIERAQYAALRDDERRSAIERRLGRGARQRGGNPLAVGPGPDQTCFAYPVRGDRTALLCYVDGRLYERQLF